jgi:fatty-acyl-CoA synthase
MPSVWEVVVEQARLSPRETAIWISDEALTFDELKRLSAAVGDAFVESGARRGERILVLSPSSVPAFVSFFAAAYARIVVAPLNPRLTAREIDEVLDRLVPRVLVFAASSGSEGADPDLARIVSAWVASRRERKLTVPALWCADEDPGPAALLQPKSLRAMLASVASSSSADTGLPHGSPTADDAFLIQMTSGSTSAPKAVLLDQGQCARMGFELGVRYDIRPGDRYFVANPIHHVGCTNYGLLAGMTHGAGFYSLRAFNGDLAIRAVQEQGCTHHHGIGAHYLYEMASPLLTPGSTRLRVITSGGAFAKKVLEAYGPVTTVTAYGSSETSGGPLATATSDPEHVRHGTSGYPLPGVEVAIVDPATGEHLGKEQVGEIWLRGWCVMREYWGNPEATARAIDAQGWYHTGDLARLNQDGNLIFATRISDFLKVGGENVAMMEVEAVLQAHPTVRQAIVVGVPHPLMGEVPVAFVVGPVGGAPATSDELVSYCTERLAKFKVPRRIYPIALEDIPMTGPGKVKKRDLADLAQRLG